MCAIHLDRCSVDRGGKLSLPLQEPLKKDQIIELQIIEATNTNELVKKTLPNRVDIEGKIISPISLDPLENCEAFKTQCCGAVIEREELITWSQTNKDFVCPLCRAELKKEDLMAPKVLKKTTLRKILLISSVSLFSSLGIANLTLAFTHELLKKPSFYNSTTVVVLGLISIVGISISSICYIEKTRREDLV